MESIPLENFIQTLELISDWHEIDQGHGGRVAIMALEIATRIDDGERIDAQGLCYLAYAARIHDLGRVGVDDIVMSKSGTLTRSQKAAMQEHSRYGFDVLRKSGLPDEIKTAVLRHHEHWDGSGYPDGLQGLDIPLFARIICVADAWDGISAKRPYHPERNPALALYEMNRVTRWFDPQLYTIFLDILREKR